ncbi:MAG: glycosyltransferase family 2 protein [Bacteroidota bacterium]
MVVKVAVIVPAFNEQDSIEGVVAEINSLNSSPEMRFDTIVINDCSLDNTAIVVKKQDCILLDLPINLGIGGAVQTGFIYAFENDYDYAVQVDGDGQHPPSEIPKLIKAISEKNLDIVIGSRFIEKTGFVSTFARRLGISFFKQIIKLYCGITITDSTSGFRIINKKTLALVSKIYPDEFPEPESIILYMKKQLAIGEVAINMRERQGGRSSIRAFNTMYYMIKVCIAIFFTYIRYRNKI